MEAKAFGRYLRISVLKLRKIINIVRGKSVKDALALLRVLPNKGAKMAYKVIHSAQANFKNVNPEETADNLVITKICADQAPYLKRWLPRARGRADMLMKGNSHLVVTVALPAPEEKK
ncbi:MAG: 50S ribosomal protein L22 [Brevinematales bacterium]|nr:50S ribosomal protein L22 [Brevinematales bacterium]OHD56768.1 MAG: 50S ribosomal protein L22 [Spirochaetes bacterium GWF1_49_6]